MRIFNPNFTPPVDNIVTNGIQQLKTFFANHPNIQFVTTEQIRANIPAATNATDGQLARIAQEAGFITD